MGDAGWVLCDLDVCVCGDYRIQHHDGGDGRCAFAGPSARRGLACDCRAYRFHRVERRLYPWKRAPGIRRVKEGGERGPKP